MPAAENIDVESYAKDKEYCLKVLEELEKFEYDKLTQTQKNQYELIQEHFTVAAVLDEYPQYDFQWYPTTGVFDKTITNLTEFPINIKQDAEDYLECLSTSGEFFDAVIDLTEWQIEQGFFVEANIVRNETAIMRAFYNADTDDLMISKSFADKLAEIGLEGKEAKELKERHEKLIDTVLKPAIKRSYEFLEDHTNSFDSEGVDRESFTRYYTAYIRSLIGSTESLEELRDYFADHLKKMIKEYNSINMEEVKAGHVDYGSPEEIVDMLRNNMQDYPELKDVSYELTEHSNSSSTILAYYVDPQIDSSGTGQIKVNPAAGSNSVLEYLVMAHEGFPGHCYQKNYFRQSEYYNPISAIFENPAYVEGWAQYAETDMLKYAGLPANEVRYWTLKEQIEYELGAFSDIVINGLGWTWQELDAFIKDSGYIEPDTKVILAKSLAASAKKSPGMYVPYGYGMQKMADLKEQEKEELGSMFDPLEFHKVILDQGSRSFARIETDLDER